MAKVERFEDLIAWQKARVLTKDIYVLTGKTPVRKDRGLTGQLQRVAVSVMSNIAEGFERKRPNEFYHFLTIAKASCAEVQSLLYVTLDVGYLHQDDFAKLFQKTDEVLKVLGGLKLSVERQKRAQAS